MLSAVKYNNPGLTEECYKSLRTEVHVLINLQTLFCGVLFGKCVLVWEDFIDIQANVSLCDPKMTSGCRHEI